MKALAQNTLIQSRYLIVQLIGKGGMGEVYLAVDQRLGSAVAIKRTFFAGDEMLGNAFEREARVLARLRHPVLPKVSDHFTENDQQFLVMEHISGDDLAKRIEALQKPFPLSWVMFWADQLLDALSYLHSHEPPIIHRDIKPQNLKLTDENHIVLLDFGLSKSSTGQTNLVTGVQQTGSTGSVVGYTPHYAPMEQIRGIGTSPRSDLYSLSATIYQLMTNVVPADALTRADAMLNGMQDPIKPVNELNPEVPPSVSDVIIRAMAVSQDKRFESAREMQKTLRKAFAEMQQAMSAKTMVISGAEATAAGMSQPSPFEATEVMDPEALRAISNPDSGSVSGFSENVSRPNAPHSTMDSTVAFDSSAVGGELKQSDVKTEVFTGGNSLPIPPEEPPRYTSDPTPPPAPQENFALTTDYSNVGAAAGAETYVPTGDAYSPTATTPFVALEGNGAGVAAAAGGAAGFAGYQRTADAATNFDSQPREQQAPAVAPPAKKRSTGKIVALLGGLFLFFVVVLAAGAGGYYYFTNFMGAAAGPAASPTPLPTVEPAPSPTSESVFTDNSNIATPTPDATPAATPEPAASPSDVPPNQPQVERPDSRPTPSGTRPTPKPRPSATVKPAQTKKPSRDLDILQ